MGTTMSPYGEPFLAILLSRIGLMISVSVLPISDAVHCNRSRSALHLLLPFITSSVQHGALMADSSFSYLGIEYEEAVI